MVDLRAAIIAAAQTRKGMPYRIDPPPDGVNNVDCSLYVLLTLRDAGVGLPARVRTAEQIRQACTVIDWPDVLPGDLLLFDHTYEPSEPAGPDGHTASHIGISLGAGTHQMWNANEVRGVSLDRIDTSSWQSHLLSAARPPALVTQSPNNPQNILEGIDVSSWQGKPDWAAVAASGIVFGIAKATEGLDYINPDFAYDWDGMRASGLVRASYHWGRPSQSAEQQARFFVDTTGPLAPGDLMMLDGEEGDGDVGAWALTFLRALEGIVGFPPLCYTGEWFSDPHGFPQHPELARYPLVAAAYQDTEPAPIPPWSKITIWQRSSTGSVPGIVGNVDLDRFYGTRAELLALGKPGAIVAPPVYVKPGEVGTGILEMMAEDGTEPALPSIFHPLGSTPSVAEECVGMNGTRYLWHLPTGRRWRYPAAA